MYNQIIATLPCSFSQWYCTDSRQKTSLNGKKSAEHMSPTNVVLNIVGNNGVRVHTCLYMAHAQQNITEQYFDAQWFQSTLEL